MQRNNVPVLGILFMCARSLAVMPALGGKGVKPRERDTFL
jgi:hypothetical protein